MSDGERMMWLPDTPQDHDNRMYEAGKADAADRIAELEAALRMLVADVQDYPAWQRPCAALDKAREVLERK